MIVESYLGNVCAYFAVLATGVSYSRRETTELILRRHTSTYLVREIFLKTIVITESVPCHEEIIFGI